jgi:multisubunit Na+/H+ antiporter MnhF subunit
MDKHKIFTSGLILLAIIILVYAAWVIVTPPASDDLHAYALVVIGIIMIIVGYKISQRDGL